MTKCIYDRHDLDGISSAAIVRYKYPNCELIPYFYNDSFPWEAFTDPEEIVLMCDVSLPAKDMAKLACICQLHWCDHHISAIEACHAACVMCDGLQDTNFSGCELTWLHLFPDLEMPRAIKLLGRYDVWDHEDPEVLPFQYGMRLQNPKPSDRVLWNSLLSSPNPYLVEQIILKGRTVLLYEQQQAQRISSDIAFPVLWEGVKFIAVNRSHVNSKFFEPFISPTDDYDACLTFAFNGKGLWRISMYATPYRTHPKILTLAKLNGGGGHAEACGCQVSNKKMMEILFGGTLEVTEIIEKGAWP